MTRLLMLVVATATFACSPRGVSVGSEDLCELPSELRGLEDPREPISNCARVGENQLTNPSFESPPVADCQNPSFCAFRAALVGWETSGESQTIEIWNDGYQDVPAPLGAQFAELNASSQDRLWQDVSLPAGQLMYWSFLHRGRIGIESVEVLIGPPGATRSQSIVAAPTDEWREQRGLYRVGQRETMTRFMLASRTGTTEGNLVDAVTFAPVD
jgi:hypothetical protein